MTRKMITTMITKSYSELAQLYTFDERLAYLKLGDGIGRETFGFDRHINQRFYTSRQWHEVRDFVIYRDEGCDLGIPGYEIHISPLIHHINPMKVEDIVNGEAWILDPEFLITTTHQTHNDIHFGSERKGPAVAIERFPGDTRLWR